MTLNIAHVQIGNMQDMAFGSNFLAEGALISAVRSMKKGFWKSDYKYKPTTQHLTKLRYRYAMFIRLEADPQKADLALRYIDGALNLQPGDAALVKERENMRGNECFDSDGSDVTTPNSVSFNISLANLALVSSAMATIYSYLMAITSLPMVSWFP